MNVRFLMVALRAANVLLACALAACLLHGADLDERILRVENGLLPAVQIKGQPARRYTVSERLKRYKTPGVSLAVIHDGKIEWARGWGLASAEDNIPVTTETLFQAASISKSVTAIVAMRLVEMGKLSLDEDVNAKLRSWKVPENEFTAKEKVTLRRLLSHTAGLTVHGFPGYALIATLPSLPQILDGARPRANTDAVRVDVTPGSVFRYSGGGYVVVQQLIEDVTGKPFAEVARELVLTPLGMMHSTYEQPLPRSMRANAATGYRGDGSAVPGKWHVYPERTAAGLWTTPSDLARVALEIERIHQTREKGLLAASTVEQMLTKVKGDYGLGFGLTDMEGRKTFGHGGANEGFRCNLFAYADSGRGVAVMTNGDNGSALANEVVRAIAAEYGWPDYKGREKEVVKVDATKLAEYAGQYQLPQGIVVTVSVEGAELYAAAMGNKIHMLAESADSFFDADDQAPSIRFAKNAEGVMQLHTAGVAGKRIAAAPATR